MRNLKNVFSFFTKKIDIKIFHFYLLISLRFYSSNLHYNNIPIAHRTHFPCSIHFRINTVHSKKRSRHDRKSPIVFARRPRPAPLPFTLHTYDEGALGPFLIRAVEIKIYDRA